MKPFYAVTLLFVPLNRCCLQFRHSVPISTSTTTKRPNNKASQRQSVPCIRKCLISKRERPKPRQLGGSHIMIVCYLGLSVNGTFCYVGRFEWGALLCGTVCYNILHYGSGYYYYYYYCCIDPQIVNRHKVIVA